MQQTSRIDDGSDGPTHLDGAVEIGGLELLHGAGMFHPQPETLDVAAWAVAHAPSAGTVVDLCAGGGTLGLLVARGLPGAHVHCVELSSESFEWLVRNIERTGLAATPHLADAAVALPHLDGGVDLVVSNPPYVAEHELDRVAADVREHEARSALVAGDDGLDLIRIVARRAWTLLRPGGLLVVEHSDRQGRSAPDVLHDQGFLDVADHHDAEGRDRFASGTKPST